MTKFITRLNPLSFLAVSCMYILSVELIVNPERYVPIWYPDTVVPTVVRRDVLPMSVVDAPG